MPCRAAAWASAAKSGGPAGGGLVADAHLGQGAQEPDGRLGVRIGDNAAT
jgi:hypothetical protein